MSLLKVKFKEVSMSVLPITLLVLLLNFIMVSLETDLIIRFLIGSFLVVLGLGVFLFGVEIGISPIGNLIGENVAKSNKVSIVLILGFILGFLVTVAEPDLQILANQIDDLSGGNIKASSILIVVSIGVGIMVALGLLRILFEKPLNKVYAVLYFIIFILGIMVSEEFLAISVDASGATTGALTTPFILALGFGISKLKGGIASDEDSFGLVGIASVGPILAVMLMSILTKTSHVYGGTEKFIYNPGIFEPFFEEVYHVMKDTLITLSPIIIVFLVFNKAKFKLNEKSRNKILKGLIYTYIGLVLFMVGVNGGFIEVGRIMGYGIASTGFKWILPLIGFLLGLVVVLAEPAVHVLTEQVENVTAGYIKKKAILATLSIGIAFAIAFSMLRIIIPKLKLWHFLLIGFSVAVFLSFKVPPIFVGIAYDAGGVASGPMTVAFILSFTHGAAEAVPTANVLVDGFGLIAMVAMTPLIAIQILGYLFKLKAKKE